jgi:hypothetical protein
MIGMNREYVCQLINGHVTRRKRWTKQRGRRHGARVDDAVQVVSDYLGWIRAERLQRAMAKTTMHLASFRALMMTEALVDDLRSISAPELCPIMKRIRQYEQLPPRRLGKPETRGLRPEIPMTPLGTKAKRDSEMDLVDHRGVRADGDDLQKSRTIDVATSWSEGVVL